MSKKTSVALLAAAICLFTALPTSAATRSSIRLVVPTTAGAAATTAPSFGSQVTFALTTTASYPWVDTQCSQNGQVVYEQWAGFFASYAGSQMFTLGPTQLWSSGAASCTASIVTYDKNGRATKVASTSFNVAG